MPDTHDARGGGADPYDWDPVYAAATIDRLQKALATETATCKRWLQRTVELGTRAANAQAACEDLREQLAAATARAEEAEARIAELGDAEYQHRAVGPRGETYAMPTTNAEDSKQVRSVVYGWHIERRPAYYGAWKPWRPDGARDAARAKFAAEMDQLQKRDPAGARWIEHILTERTAQQPDDDTTEGR
jgi:hypothetical protein